MISQKDLVCSCFKSDCENVASSRTSCISLHVSADHRLVNTPTLNCCCHTQRNDGSTSSKDKSFLPHTDVKMKTNAALPGTCCFQEAIAKKNTGNQNDFMVKDDHKVKEQNKMLKDWTEC